MNPEPEHHMLLFEVEDTLIASKCVSPWVYPLGVHFAQEQIEWETGKPSRLLMSSNI